MSETMFVDPPIYSLSVSRFDGEERFHVGKDVYEAGEKSSSKPVPIGQITQIDRIVNDWGVEYIIYFHDNTLDQTRILARIENMRVSVAYDRRAGR